MMCPREEVLCSRERLARVRKIEPDLMLIFEHGHGLHDRLQNSILPSIGVLRGKWICNGCGEMHGGAALTDQAEAQRTFEQWAVPKPLKCEHCGCNTFRYHEIEWFDEGLRFKGHPDGYLVLPGVSGMGVLEAKSIKAGWSIKNVPKLDHAIQLQSYLLFSGLAWGIILYWIKGDNGLEALVEHFVERDEDTLTNIRNTIRGIRSGIAGGPLPERVCTTSSCPRATDCVVSGQCFEAHEEEDDGEEHPF